MLICFKVTPKTKIGLVKNRFCVKISVFLNLSFVLVGALENYREIFTFDSFKVPARLTFLSEMVLFKKIQVFLLS